MSSPPSSDAQRLAEQLGEVTRREAWFRVKTAQDFLVLDTQLKAHRKKVQDLFDELAERNSYVHQLHLEREEQLKTHHKKVQDLSAELAERNSYIHQLHLEREEQLKAHWKKVQDVSNELAERNSYIHQLHLEREERLQRAPAEREEAARREPAVGTDLATFAQMLAGAEAEGALLRAKLVQTESTWGWKLTRWLRRLQEKFAPLKTGVSAEPASLPGYDFVYFLNTSPFRIYRAERFTLKGWAFPRDGRAITAVRVRIGDRGDEFPARWGMDAPGVAEQYGAQPNNPRPGFEVEFATPPGRQFFRLEAQLDGREWFSILSMPIWVVPDPKGS